ncbi:Leucine Rich Repeat [Seminavis robusta]|uniref:Leucine Rich Repeat n=1 Tax=Seminavis robusta TaxID=568900 RepID=A0A9N8DPR3_9STRA|nr:Leucine Rich Repeat [Seminavis robusta]|eukprot:Sro283_g107640.1 Leucine Rich Repeat (782) ;mRNA; f:3599-6163
MIRSSTTSSTNKESQAMKGTNTACTERGSEATNEAAQAAQEDAFDVLDVVAARIRGDTQDGLFLEKLEARIVREKTASIAGGSITNTGSTVINTEEDELKGKAGLSSSCQKEGKVLKEDAQQPKEPPKTKTMSSDLTSCSSNDKKESTSDSANQQMMIAENNCLIPGAYAVAPGALEERATTICRSLVGAASSSDEFSVEANDTEEGLIDPELGLPSSTRAQSTGTTISMTGLSLQEEELPSPPPTNMEEQTSRSLLPQDDTGSSDNNSGLAVADLVEEIQPDQLPQAQTMDAEQQKGSHPKRRQRSKEIKTIAFVAVILLVAALVVVIAILVPTKDNETSPSSPPITSSPVATTAVPTTDVLPSFLLGNNETLQALQDPDSPQSQAYTWLLELHNQNNYSNARLQQRFALATLYFATGGQAWGDNTHWLNHSVHECDWFQQPSFALKHVIAMYASGYLAGFLEPTDNSTTTITPCDSDGVYQHLWLDQNNLAGSLPTELYLLSSLQTLSMGRNSALQGVLFFMRNQLEGSLPSELWQLTNLVHMALYGNPQLEGTVPTEIGTISNLKTFAVDELNLSGTIPSELGKLKELSVLVFQKNSFQNTLPTELGLLTSLIVLRGHSNQLSGPLPSELGLLTNLQQSLSFQDNRLSQTIPTELGLLTGLDQLVLDGNQFSGQIPAQFCDLAAVKLLSLSNNSLSGNLPTELSSLQPHAHTIRVDGNPLLSGTVPDGLCALNGTCIGTAWNPCSSPTGFVFDCTDTLCGCGCDCTNIIRSYSGGGMK